MQQLSIQTGQQRVFVRHGHGHSPLQSARAAYNQVLLCDNVGGLYIDIGDWNEFPAADLRGAASILFLDVCTYRHSSKRDPCSCICGAVVCPQLGRGGVVRALPFSTSTQPFLAQIVLKTVPQFHDF